MTLTNTSEDSLLLLLFENASWTNIGDAGGILQSVAAGSWTIGLHTADPGETGSMTNEADYTGYNVIGGGSEVTVARTSAAWSVTTGVASNDAVVTFPEATGGSNTITHFSIHSLIDDAMLGFGALTASLAVSTGITPEFAAGDLTITAD